MKQQVIEAQIQLSALRASFILTKLDAQQLFCRSAIYFVLVTVNNNIAFIKSKGPRTGKYSWIFL
jgi:hypothetical protein